MKNTFDLSGKKTCRSSKTKHFSFDEKNPRKPNMVFRNYVQFFYEEDLLVSFNENLLVFYEEVFSSSIKQVLMFVYEGWFFCIPWKKTFQYSEIKSSGPPKKGPSWPIFFSSKGKYFCKSDLLSSWNSQLFYKVMHLLLSGEWLLFFCEEDVRFFFEEDCWP